MPELKLSPHYRQDGITPPPAGLRDYLDEHFWKHLAHIDKTNPKLLVTFVGGNGVGKSALSQKISQEFGGLILQNDAVKACLLQKQPELTRTELSQLTWQYTMDLYRRLPQLTRNGLVIRDGVIQWYYEQILPLFTGQGYQLYIVHYHLSKQKSIELITSRGDTPTTTAQRLIDILPDQEIHIARFLKEYTPDIVLTDDTLFNHSLVINDLRKQLQSIRYKE